MSAGRDVPIVMLSSKDTLEARSLLAERWRPRPQRPQPRLPENVMAFDVVPVEGGLNSDRVGVVSPILNWKTRKLS